MKFACRLLGITAAALTIAACGYPDVSSGSSGGAAGTVATVPSPSPGAPTADSFGEGAALPPIKFPDGLQVADIKVGEGATVKKGDKLSMQYTGWLASGSKFDSSRDRGTPFDVAIGTGQVIPGWDEGIPGMKVGGKRRLTIPPALGYGAQGSGQTIPPNSTLIFVVELVSIAPTPSPSPS